MPRHCLKSFWSLKFDFDNDFPAKTPKLYSTTTTVETAIDPTQFLVETPPFWPFSKYTDPSSTDPGENPQSSFRPTSESDMFGKNYNP